MFGLLGALMNTEASAAPRQLTARVVRLGGQVQVSPDGAQGWTSLHPGDLVKAGSVIRTAAKSSVDLILDGGAIPANAPAAVASASSGGAEGTANVVRLWENSTLGIDRLISERTGTGTVEETGLDLRAGRVTGNVKKLSAASKYEIKMPGAVAGIRGTGYDLSGTGDVVVYEGSVMVGYVDPATGRPAQMEVKAGQKFNPKTDKEPQTIPRDQFEVMYQEWLKLKGTGYTPPPGTFGPDPTILWVTPLNGAGPTGGGSTPPAPPLE